MAKKIELAKVPAGKSVEVFGKKFTVLEHTESGVLLLSEIVETEMPFRYEREARAAPNDFRDSDIQRWLNGKYLDELIKNGADENKDILDMEIDLKCTLGQREYGFCIAKAGLLTLEQYGKYFDIIKPIVLGGSRLRMVRRFAHLAPATLPTRGTSAPMVTATVTVVPSRVVFAPLWFLTLHFWSLVMTFRTIILRSSLNFLMKTCLQKSSAGFN